MAGSATKRSRITSNTAAPQIAEQQRGRDASLPESLADMEPLWYLAICLAVFELEGREHARTTVIIPGKL